MFRKHVFLAVLGTKLDLLPFHFHLLPLISRPLWTAMIGHADSAAGQSEAGRTQGLGNTSRMAAIDFRVTNKRYGGAGELFRMVDVLEAAMKQELTMRHSKLLAMTAVLAAFTLPAASQPAQTVQRDGSMQGMQGMSNMENMNPFQKDTMAAMEKMNKAMMQGMMDQDPGMAWLKSMAAHHQGAIDMSEIVLRHTKDAEIAKEARKTAQENEKSLKEVQTKIRKEDKKS